MAQAELSSSATQAMTPKIGYLMICYGLFLAAMGLAGYASNPEKAKTALISGGTFGALSMLWGWFMTRGANWSRWAALATTVLLTGVFTWRASVSWMAYAGGASEKLVAALLITTMGAASLAMLVALLRAARRPRS
jgi:uncharacterized membrane protein (UPF0136 family)